MSAERSAALVRRWVALYTLGLPPEIKQGRRDEIDDDLWCQAQEAADSGRGDGSLAGEIVMRLVLGLPADISWRATQRRTSPAFVAPERSPTMDTRAVVLLSFVGGIGWAIWPIPQAIVGREWPPGEPISAVLLLSVWFGTWGIAGAIVALAVLIQDSIRTPFGAVASIGAFIGSVSVFGAYAGIIAIPIASAAVVWEAPRAGVLSRSMLRAHLATASVVIAMLIIFLSVPAIIDNVWLAAAALGLVLPYAATWLAIGWSLRHVPAIPKESVAGA
jgi:hypothetical protein